MLKKFLVNIKIFFHYLFIGMRSADTEMTTGGKTASADGSAIEQKKEQDSLYAALLRGEVTQEVKEARHEMYYAERRSHDYIYNGGGHAKKLDGMFDYDGNVERSDGHRVLIVQDNYQDQASIDEYGIDEGHVKDYGSEIYKSIKMEDIAKKEFTIKIVRDFIPKFRIEEFTKKIVVKDLEEKRILDIYVSKYPVEFNRRSRMFVNMIEEIYQGNVRSELLDFKTLSFISRNAYGTDDLKLYSFGEFEFRDIIDYDGNYVLRFVCVPEINGEDLIEEFYDETAQKKSDERARRKNATMDFDTAAEIVARDSYDAVTAEKLLGELNEGSGTEIQDTNTKV